MTEKFEPIDALQNPIKLGAIYGYSSSSGGWSKTAVGRATKLTKSGMVTIEVLSVRHFLYGQPIERSGDDAKSVSVRPHLLFPVHEANNG